MQLHKKRLTKSTSEYSKTRTLHWMKKKEKDLVVTIKKIVSQKLTKKR